MSEFNSFRQLKERGVSVSEITQSIVELNEQVELEDLLVIAVSEIDIYTAFSTDDKFRLIGLLEKLKLELLEDEN